MIKKLRWHFVYVVHHTQDNTITILLQTWTSAGVYLCLVGLEDLFIKACLDGGREGERWPGRQMSLL